MQSFTPDPTQSQTLNFTDENGIHWSQIIPAVVQITKESFLSQISQLQSDVASLDSEISGYDSATQDLANRKAQDESTKTDKIALIAQLTAQMNAEFPE